MGKNSKQLTVWAEVQARNLGVASVAQAEFEEGGGCASCYGKLCFGHVRTDELNGAHPCPLEPLLKAQNDVAVFAWFEHNFGDAIHRPARFCCWD